MRKDHHSDIERLHFELFGAVPAKHGTAYERIAAVVMAVLGWEDVEYDQTQQPEGLLASHQLDVRCRRPDGTRSQLIIECKDVGARKKVNKDVLLKLALVQRRLAAEHAAVVTTTDYTRGARQVAVDHDIALIRLRPYDSDIDDGTWIRAVEFELQFGFVVPSDIELLTESGFVAAEDADVRAESWMEARTVDGAVSVTVGDLFAQGRVLSEREGVIKKELVLGDPMEIESWSGWARIKGLRWTETTQWATERFRTEATGDPRLVLQQLDQNGAPVGGRVIVTTKLQAWTIDESAHKVQRRQLY